MELRDVATAVLLADPNLAHVSEARTWGTEAQTATDEGLPIHKTLPLRGTDSTPPALVQAHRRRPQATIRCTLASPSPAQGPLPTARPLTRCCGPGPAPAVGREPAELWRQAALPPRGQEGAGPLPQGWHRDPRGSSPQHRRPRPSHVGLQLPALWHLVPTMHTGLEWEPTHGSLTKDVRRKGDSLW